MTITLISAGVLATAVSSCVWDVRRRRIPNALTLASALAGCLVHAATAGLTGAAFSAGGWATGLLLFLPWFVAGAMGGGDVKLLAAFGAWLGPAQTVWACLFAMLAGGVLAIAMAVRLGRLRPLLAATLGIVSPALGARLGPTGGPEDGRAASLAYALPIAAGVGLSLWLR